MTTCAYDGQYLAADSRSTNGATSYKSYKCSHCGEESNRVNDEAIKIYGDFSDKKYRGEVIYAMAGSGSLADIKKVVDLVQKGENLDELYRVLQAVNEHRTAFDVSFIIVTEKSVFVLKNNPDTKKVAVKHYERTEKVAIGSGATAARFAMKAMNMTSMEAVMASTIGDEHTGGDIRWVDCSTPAGKPDTHSVIKYVSVEESVNGIKRALTLRFGGEAQKPAAKKTTRRNAVTA